MPHHRRVFMLDLNGRRNGRAQKRAPRPPLDLNAVTYIILLLLLVWLLDSLADYSLLFTRIVVGILVGIPVIVLIYGAIMNFKKVIEELQKYEENKRGTRLTGLYGRTNSAMTCPHCQEKGKVRVKPVEQKKEASGAKATGAILTGGASLLFTGLSRKEQLTQVYCDNCHNTWNF